MKKFCVIVAACALAACGQPTPPATTADSAVTFPTGSFDGYGENPEFEFIADTRAQAIELRMNYETVGSAPYVAPQPNGAGARIVSGDVTVDLTPGPCTAFGAAYPLNLTVQVAGHDPVRGCAIERWDTHLLDMIPYIDACIATSPTTRWVSYARADGDIVTVRLSGDNVFQDCTAQRGNPQSAASHLTDENLKLPGQSAAIFVRGPGADPGGECYEAPEVRSASGELLGWMADPMGC